MSKPAAAPPEHLLVRNPFTNKLINVLPLLELMSQNNRSLSGPDDLRLRIQTVHDYVSTHVATSGDSEFNAAEWAEMNYTLIEFRKTFERMQEIHG